MPPVRPLLLFVLAAGPAAGADLPRYVPTPADLVAGYARAGRPTPRAYKLKLTPHWLPGGDRFWYRNDLPGDAKGFVLVDAAAGTRGPAFDHTKLAAALSAAAGRPYRPDRLPFDDIRFRGAAVRFRVGDSAWTYDPGTDACTPADDPAPKRPDRPAPRGPSPTNPTVASPDRKWTATIQDHNVVLRAADGRTTKLTWVGSEDLPYDYLSWSPDSAALVAYRVEPGADKPVHLLESSPPGGGRAVLRSRPYPLPGDKLTTYEPHLFDVAAGKEIPVPADKIDSDPPGVRWAANGRTFTYPKTDRGHQRFRLVEVDARTGRTRTLIDETAKTFIWSAHNYGADLPTISWLPESNEIVLASEKSGWRHLYLIDAAAGAEKNPITRGDWVVRGLDHIDRDRRQVWFRAGGREPGQDPYFVHHYRVNLDGTGLVRLTDGDGTHTAQFSPGRKYLIDTFSRVDRPPAHVLRRGLDGSEVCRLEEADVTEVTNAGGEAPEVFSAKGRDGTTDIWGIICRPRGFDPGKRYPVIEHIYAGPHGSFVPKAFAAARPFADLTDLGFVVVQIDGMGTANRSKAFHDVCWHDLKDAGFPDRIPWHKAVAAKYPWYDVSRVGIYGGSAGGQNAAGAVLFHPDFYKVAVAGCGCHDNRLDKASWNEQWMGYPVGPHYAASSNVDHAHRLRGKLLLIVGELDANVPPESTYRLCDALNKAGKDYDFVLVPGAGHGMGGAYGWRRLRDFFVRHMHAVGPPDRNAPG